MATIQVDANAVYEPFFLTQKRYAVLRGGAGSGKSYVAAQKIVIRCVSEPNHRILVTRKVYRTIKESVFKLFKTVITAMNVSANITASPMSITFDNGSELVFMGLDDPEKLKSISDITGIWCEEMTEFTQEDFEQLNLRLRGLSPSYKQIICTFNPVSTANWVYDYFFAKPAQLIQDDLFEQLTTYLDNPFSGVEYSSVLNALADTNPEWYKIYALGEWGQAEGLIYNPFKVLNTFPDSFDEVIYGVDFGFNNPSAIVKIGIKDKQYYLTELLYETGLTNPDLVKRLKEFNINKNDRIYCDAAEPDRITEFKRASFQAFPADKAVKSGIDFVKSNNTKIFSHPNNVNINKEIGLYSWKKDTNGRATEEPIKMHDHILDAIRYALWTHLGKKGETTFEISFVQKSHR